MSTIAPSSRTYLRGRRRDRFPEPRLGFDGAGRAGRGARAMASTCHVESGYIIPFGIYTIPEISFIGKTEEQLTDEDVPYEVGVAYYREIARGQIRGDTTGRLKLIFHRETLEILGVHIIGEGASELLHIGQAVLILRAKWTILSTRFQLSDVGGVLQGRGV